MNVKEQLVWQKIPPKDEGTALTPKLKKGCSAEKNHSNIQERKLLIRSRTGGINRLDVCAQDNEIPF